ncbi:ATP-binding protein [Alkalicoccobacillus porphyridii]|nr:sensor histidine kinase [Alkalicoccobacillus porphyridii]
MRKRKLTLRTRIFLFVTTIILLLILLSSIVYSVLEFQDSKRNYQTLSRQTANSLSHMQTMGEAIINHRVPEIEAMTNRASHQTGNPIISVVDRNGVILVHPHHDVPGEEATFHQLNHALVFGAYITEESDGSEGEAILTIAPIYYHEGISNQLVGAVVVEYPMEMIYEDLYRHIEKVIWIALLSLVSGGIGAGILAQKIKRDTLGLEPSTISQLYKQRNAILQSIKEGIVAIDMSGHITLMNPSAKDMIIQSKGLGNELSFVSELGLTRVIGGQKFEPDKELEIEGKTFIVNSVPIHEKERVVGAIASFRDKTEMRYLVETLSEVKQYSDGLRAHTHEYTNKLYVLLGLLELGEQQEAIAFIKEETTHQSAISKHILKTIADVHIQAILFGKLAKASEKKVDLVVDVNSSVDHLPNHLSLTKMTLIIGNLLDNAMEAVMEQNKRFVSFFITDLGRDIVIEVKDNGPGFTDLSLVDKGMSKKGSDRGFGLYNVEETINQLAGSMEIHQPDEGGSLVVVYLPKTLERGDEPQ